MSIIWNKVTWYSQAIALLIFVVTFVLAFYLGVTWERVHIESALREMPAARSDEVASSTVPETSGVSAPTAVTHCGGFIKGAPTCADGYHCQLSTTTPDKGGVCVADNPAAGGPAPVVQQMPAPIPGKLGDDCGGTAVNAPICGAGLHCDLVGSRTDGGGTCVLNQESASPLPASAQ